jgi:hypothetical protein
MSSGTTMGFSRPGTCFSKTAVYLHRVYSPHVQFSQGNFSFDNPFRVQEYEQGFDAWCPRGFFGALDPLFLSFYSRRKKKCQSHPDLGSG